MPPETRYARSGDVHIAYQVIGSGPFDLVFVPGFISHVDYVWDEPRWSAFLERLASFSRLICFDKRGTGLSDRISATAQQTASLFNTSSARASSAGGISKSKQFCGRDINNEIEFGRSHHRQVSRTIALYYVNSVHSGLVIVLSFRSIAHQSTCNGELTILIDHGNRMTGGPRRALDRPQIAGCTQQPACLLFPRATPQLKRFRAARQPDLVGNPSHLLSMPGEAQRTGAKRRPSAPAR